MIAGWLIAGLWLLAGIMPPAAVEPAHNQQLREMEDALIRQIEATPDDVNLFHRLAHLRFRLGDRAGVGAALDAADRIAPNEPYSSLLRGAVAEESLDFSAATEFYRTTLERNPSGEMGRAQLTALEGWIATLSHCEDARDTVDLRLSIAISLWLVSAYFAFRFTRHRSIPSPFPQDSRS